MGPSAQAAWLAALARQAGAHRLLIVGAFRDDAGHAAGAGLAALRQKAVQLLLLRSAAGSAASGEGIAGQRDVLARLDQAMLAAVARHLNERAC